MSEKLTVEERLNDIISEKDDEIYELNEKVATLEKTLDYHRWSWQRHTTIDGNDPLYKDIPYPRLEMFLNRISERDWYSIEWVYGIVYKHFTDIRNNNLLFIPLGRTTSNGGQGTFESRLENGKLETPFRDGLHIKVEALTLDLPVYITCKEKNMIQKIEISDEDKTRLKESLDAMIKQ